MKVVIKEAQLSGTVAVPSSKSEAHRAMICAALSDAPSRIYLNGICSDIEATADCLEALGAGVVRTEYGYELTPIENVRRGACLRCRDSGSTLRFLIPVAAALDAECTFYMEGKLSERPLSPLDSELARCGVRLERDGKHLRLSGRLEARELSISGSVSSQFVSGLMFALPLLGGGQISLVGKTESLGYIKLTCAAMERFGVRVSLEKERITLDGEYRSPGELTVPGDWSGASFWAVAGAMSKNGITCTGVDTASKQGDRRILEVVRELGAELTVGDNMFMVRSRGRLRAADFCCEHIPDALPVMAVAASTALGKSVLSGGARLRYKESDRLATVSELISRMNGDVRVYSDGLIINGRERLCGAVIDPHADHRIAMCAAVAAAAADGDVTVTDAECVSKSYPTFWEDFAALGGQLEIS